MRSVFEGYGLGMKYDIIIYQFAEYQALLKETPIFIVKNSFFGCTKVLYNLA